LENGNGDLGFLRTAYGKTFLLLNMVLGEIYLNLEFQSMLLDGGAI